MFRLRLRRLLGVVSIGLLAAASLGVSPVSAANPNWDIDIVPVPARVGAGHDAGFIVTVSNDGPSQINDLSVTVTPLDTPTALWTYLSPLVFTVGGPASCDATAPLTCQLGTLQAGASVTFTVAYAVPDEERGSFELKVAIKAGTGDTEADGPKGKSRGDAYSETGAALIGGGNFDGGFVVGDDSFQTDPNLGPRNIQSTALEGTSELIGVMIEDGITDVECDELVEPSCTGLFAEWSALHVGDGATFSEPFKVTLVIRGSAVPGGTTEADIVVVHVLDDGTINVIGDEDSETCAFDAGETVPNNAECLTVTKVGGNWKIDVWLLVNGWLRGGV